MRPSSSLPEDNIDDGKSNGDSSSNSNNNNNDHTLNTNKYNEFNMTKMIDKRDNNNNDKNKNNIEQHVIPSEVNKDNKQDESSSIVRQTIGTSMNRMSQLINDNLIVARYGVTASILLLTAYGISQTPLLLRFRTVSDIPWSYFVGRRKVYGRIMKIVINNKKPNGITSHTASSNPQQVSLSSLLKKPSSSSSSTTTTTTSGQTTSLQKVETNSSSSIHIFVHHLSPLGRVVPASWWSSSSTWYKQSIRHHQDTDWLRIQIAGIEPPPSVISSVHGEYNQDDQLLERWLEQLAEKQTFVSCRLLSSCPYSNPTTTGTTTTNNNNENESSLSTSTSTIAIGHLNYWPTWWQNILPFASTDIAEILVRSGIVTVSTGPLATIIGGSTSVGNDNTASNNKLHFEGGGYRNNKNSGGMATSTMDTNNNNNNHIVTSQNVNDLRKDVQYIERLLQIELTAAKEKKGIWSNPQRMKETTKGQDVLQEAEFQTTATWYQKVWRRLRG